MLSDYERRELALIEQGLEADPRLAASLSAGRRPRRWPIRLLTALGILLVVTGLLTSTGGLVLQGLLAVGAAVVWSRWRDWRTARGRRAPP
jgi:uncharacterized membrane protein YphA (DoxX/SURF4 family)